LPKTVYELLAERAEEIRSLTKTLALEHGDLEWHDPSRGGILVVGPDRSWSKLDVDGRQLQSRLRASFGEFMELVSALLLDLPEGKARDVEGAKERVTDVIEREWTFNESTAQAFEDASTSLDLILGQVADLYDGSGGAPIYVPDTNALLFNPDLDRWRFGKEQFTILLTPLVLSELDELKLRSRNPDLAAKAEGLITRIKGYRDRGGGNLASGVTLRKVRGFKTSFHP
jgi:hypothetical protein